MNKPRCVPPIFLSILLAAGFAAPLSANELVPLIEFETETDFSQNFSAGTGILGLSVAHSSADDGGIGLGGFVETPPEIGETVNIVYDTDGLWGTQTFGDVTIAVDHQTNHSVGFIVRGNSFRNDSIRVLLTNGARVRMWTGSNVFDHQPTGDLQYDVTGDAVSSLWSHLRLDVRNAGEGGNQIELVFRAYDSQARFDETTLVAEHSLLLGVEESAPYLEPGEIGLRMVNQGSRIDNFAVYEHGTAPAALPHPELVDFAPLPGTQIHEAAEGLSFHARSPSGVDADSISILLNGADAAADTVISGDPDNLLIQVGNLEPETDYEVSVSVAALSGEITTLVYHFRTGIPPTPVPLINLIEFAGESEVTGTFTSTTAPAVSFVEDWDRGIGRGGFARTGGTGNFMYDLGGEGTPPVFQDFSATIDHRLGASLAFIIRGDTAADRSIRVMLTNRNRIRVWSGSGITTNETGENHLDETMASGLTTGEWVHMRLDVRNAGEEWSPEIEIRLQAFASQHDLTSPAFDQTVVIPASASANYLEAGEIGFRAVGTNDIDNFGIYEYGTAPVFRPHPVIDNIFPPPDVSGLEDESTFFFEVAGNLPNPQSGVRVWFNQTDVSGQLSFTGDELGWLVSHPGVQPDTSVMIEVTNDEAVTTAFFDYPPTISPFAGRVRLLYDSGGFENDDIFPLGDLQEVVHGAGEWVPHASAPEILLAEEPYNKILRRHQMGGTQRDWLHFPVRKTGIVTLEMDVRVSTAAVRTLDLSFTAVGAGGTQRSFIAWGTLDNQFTFYDGSNWIPVFEPGDNQWHRYKMVNYLTGAHASTFDLFVDGELIGEKLPFRSAFNPELHDFSAVRFNAASGPEGEYADIDNVVLTHQPLMGADQLPFSRARVADVTEAGANVSFDTYAGFAYRVQYIDTLGEGEWLDLETVDGNGLTMTVTDPSPNPDRRFYRVVTLPLP